MDQTHRPFRAVTDVSIDPQTTRVYEFGWQSWSPTAAYPVSLGAGFRATQPKWQTPYYRREMPAPVDAFQGEGLLAVELAPGGPIHVIALPDGRSEVPTIRARRRHDVLEVSADGAVDHVVDEGTGGLYGALARFADRYTEFVGRPQLREVPPIWASWYQYFREFNEEDLRRNLDLMDGLELPIEIVRLDDAFQACIGDWLTPSSRFSSLDGMFSNVLDRGRRAGIWSAPFLVGSDSVTFAEHPDWLVRDRTTGEPLIAQRNWHQDCYVLDTTHPGAAEYLERVFSTYASYGASYFMIDFLYAGAIEGIRHDDVDAISAYRDGLRLIRRAIGPDSLLQACGAPMFPSIGLVDTMRVGTDVAVHWDAPEAEMARPATQGAVVSTVGRGFTHGRFWLSDPDCIVARPQIEGRERWADVVERYGPVRISSDGLDQLDGWGLETTRRLLQPARLDPLDPDEAPIDAALFNDLAGVPAWTVA